MPSRPTVTPPPAPPPPFQFNLKPTRQPMLWAALAYAAGVCAGTKMLRPASWWVVAGIAFLAAGVYFLRRRRWLGASLVLGAFFLGGALHIQLRGSTNVLDTALQPFTNGKHVELTAHVTRGGRLR